MEPRERLRWREYAVAAFATFHIICVIASALPRPPATGDDVLAHPEVRAELSNANLSDEQARRLLVVVREYCHVTNSARDFVGPYVRFTGTAQSWHMFGGTPPRFPLVFVVEVQPRGESAYVLFQDLNWGTADSAAMNFRHRKVHENLAAWGFGWDNYAQYWARRWNEQHADRPAERVRLSVTRLTTPEPERVRAGDNDRRPERDLQVHVWAAP